MAKPITPPNEYPFGSEIVLQLHFLNRAGVDTNPTDVTCNVTEPDGTVVILTANPTPDVGIYEAIFESTKSGRHWYMGKGTGALIARNEQAFEVLERHVEDV
jgi:hypothetical protein